MSPRVNVVAWPELELAYCDVIDKNFSLYDTGAPLLHHKGSLNDAMGDLLQF